MDDDELLRSLEAAGGDLASLFSQDGFAARLRATASAWDAQAASSAGRAPPLNLSADDFLGSALGGGGATDDDDDDASIEQLEAELAAAQGLRGER
jgi:hypothetical protein